MLRASQTFEEPHELDSGFIRNTTGIQILCDNHGPRFSCFVPLVECRQSVFVFFRRDACLIENASQNLSMIHTNYEIIEAQRNERIPGRRDQLSLNHH